MHSYIREYEELYKQGKLTRREFMFYTTTLGMSAAAATAFMAACGGSPTPTTTVSLPATPTMAAGTTEATATTGPAATKAPATATSAPAASPTASAAGQYTPEGVVMGPGPKRGGTLREANRILRYDMPWKVEWPEAFRTIRQVAEHLVYYDTFNVIHGRLAESWDVSDDLLTWTFKLRQGVKWNNGKDFTSEDVAWSIQQMTKKDVNPQIASSFSGVLKPEGITAPDQFTVKCQLDKADVALPYYLATGTGFILPKEFGGDFAKEPFGTGPFIITEYIPSERITYKANPNYWRQGADGKPLPYLDGMVWTDYGEEAAVEVAAMASGQSDFIMNVEVSTVKTIEAMSAAKMLRMRSPGASIIRMRIDKEPFTDEKVRTALKLCMDRKQILDTAYLGFGDLAWDAHTAPGHPDAYLDEPPKQDIEKAKALLKEAGKENLTVDLNIKPEPQWEGVMAQILKEQAAQAGITINIVTSPSADFWNNWDKYDFATVAWESSYPLAIVMMNTAYRCGVAWNETRFCAEEFDKMLDAASAVLDPKQRQTNFKEIQAYHRAHGGVMHPFSCNRFAGSGKNVYGFLPSPSLVDHHETYIVS